MLKGLMLSHHPKNELDRPINEGKSNVFLREQANLTHAFHAILYLISAKEWRDPTQRAVIAKQVKWLREQLAKLSLNCTSLCLVCGGFLC
jgi:hypothetical protein